ncbi:aldo/keto reductase [Celeribacter indicus]|uniref:Aldo/keto reductase n=1 Tax=Celeribacter indicus TaxID=1208324 RepID=A0A0B5E8C5_9RHOB|nr:aldo/keto reductase [Celeribacter indicus]AJE48572.1 aldo/keto reductase [Celeribacter indicus]SDX08733.1 Predicted oxidoreductase [Celeribacter indicus]
MTMPKRRLGAEGPTVSAIGFGSMSFGGFFGPADDDTSLETLAAVAAAGIDFWDTANIYGMGRAERIVGQYLKQTGARITLATKAGIIPGPPRHYSNDADYIRAELESSLQKLNRDKVELYYIHRREEKRPVEEVAETMGRLIEEGLIDAWGLSEVAPSTIRRAHRVVPLTAVQNEYSLWTRLPELGVIQTCEDLGIAFIPFSPIGRGALGVGDLDPQSFGSHDFRKQNPRFLEPNWSENMDYIRAFRRFAEDKGVTPPALAIAWVLHQGDHLIPIPGTRTAEHLADWAQAAEIGLSEDDLWEIEQILPAGWAAGDRYSDTQLFGVERYC